MTGEPLRIEIERIDSEDVGRKVATLLVDNEEAATGYIADIRANFWASLNETDFLLDFKKGSDILQSFGITEKGYETITGMDAPDEEEAKKRDSCFWGNMEKIKEASERD